MVCSIVGVRVVGGALTVIIGVPLTGNVRNIPGCTDTRRYWYCQIIIIATLLLLLPLIIALLATMQIITRRSGRNGRSGRS